MNLFLLMFFRHPEGNVLELLGGLGVLGPFSKPKDTSVTKGNSRLTELP